MYSGFVHNWFSEVNTVAFIAGKKNPATQNFFFVFPLKESLKNYFKGEIESKIQFRPT
jgi:hypothetical protein